MVLNAKFKHLEFLLCRCCDEGSCGWASLSDFCNHSLITSHWPLISSSSSSSFVKHGLVFFFMMNKTGEPEHDFKDFPGSVFKYVCLCRVSLWTSDVDRDVVALICSWCWLQLISPVQIVWMRLKVSAVPFSHSQLTLCSICFTRRVYCAVSAIVFGFYFVGIQHLTGCTRDID